MLIVLLVGVGSVLCIQILLSTDATAKPLLQGDELEISKVESSDPIQVGAQLVYTLTYQNTSTETLSGVIITDALDPNVTYVGASLAPDGGLGDRPYWTVGSLTPSVSGEIVVTVVVDSVLLNGSLITNVVTIDSDATEPASDLITTTVAAPTLTLTKSDSHDPVTSGAPLTFTLRSPC